MTVLEGPVIQGESCRDLDGRCFTPIGGVVEKSQGRVAVVILCRILGECWFVCV